MTGNYRILDVLFERMIFKGKEEGERGDFNVHREI